MPTESKTATKRATKKRRTKRASAAADEGLDDDGNSKTQRATKTPRKSTRKTTKARSKSVTTDDDFGSGLSDDEAPAKKTVKKKRKASAKKATSRKKSSDDDSDVPAKKSAEKKPAVKKRKSTKKKKAAEPADDFGAELEFESEAKETVSEKPKRTRRRKPSEDSSNDTDSGSRSARAESDSSNDASESDASDSRESSGGRSGRSRSSSSRSDRSRSDNSRSDNSDESRKSEGDSDSTTAEGESANTEKSSSRDGDTDSDSNRRGRRRRGRRGRGRRGGNGGSEERGPRNQRSGSGGSGSGGGGNKRGRDRGPSKDIEPVSTHVTGVLEMHPKGYGFVRDRENDYAAQETDPFVSTAFIDRYNLREGVLIAGEVGAGHRGQGPRLTSIEAIEGSDPEEYVDIKDFDRLTPINPEEHIKLEMGASPVTTRVIDLLCPIGKGQRALIVAPPRSGKTILLQQMADAVAFNHPECHLMVMLIDERPEEVTEMRRHVKGEVIASSIDRDLENHVRVSQLVIERAKRLAEMGKDVFILLDSITRLARAFNKYTNTGRTGSGGIDVRAMDKPKKIFGSARVFDEGGSITVVGTALIQTGSRMDDVIFEEFKGTGNMELVLSRELADRRIWPAMDVEKSGTRREEKLLPPDVLEGVTMMRRSLISLHPVEAMEQLVRTLSKFDTNAEFLSRIRSVM